MSNTQRFVSDSIITFVESVAGGVKRTERNTVLRQHAKTVGEQLVDGATLADNGCPPAPPPLRFGQVFNFQS